MSTTDFGVNVIGFISGKLGIGVAARATLASLVRCGVPTVAVDVQLPGNRSAADTSWTHLCLPDAVSSGLPHPVNLIHMNPFEAASFCNNYPSFFEHTYNIIVPFWELSSIPHSWVPLLANYHLVLAASAYIEAAITKISSAPVRMYRMGIEGKPPSAFDGRARFELPRDAFIFALSFDTDSGLNRKNAAAAVRAFDIAFAGRSDVQLVIKLNGQTRSAELTALLNRLATSARYRVIDEYLPYPEVLGLYDACDAYISLHRSEGLGLGLMEAMSLGKPVIATGWSGNMDFMDESNSCPVNFTLTPVVDSNVAYDPQRTGAASLWAEPDLHHAIMLLRRVRHDASYRERISAGARRSIEERNASFFNGRYVKTILECYLSFSWERQQLARLELQPT